MQSDSDEINQQPLQIDVPEIPSFSQNQSQLDNKLTFAGLNNNIQHKLTESNLSLKNQKQERNLMSKNTMQSGVSLQQTGRFEVTEERSLNLGSDLKYQGTNLIGSEESPDQRDFKMNQGYREAEELQENEMRETSYFKHVSNEHGSSADLHQEARQNHSGEQGHPPEDKKFSEIITIQMQEQTSSAEKSPNREKMSLHNAGENEAGELDDKRGSIPMDKGIQLFKMSSRNHMRQRSNRNTKVMERGPNPSIDVNSIVNSHQKEPNTPADTSDNKFFNNQQIKPIEPQTPNESNKSSGKKKISMIHSRHSRFEGNKSLDNTSPSKGLRQISISKPSNIEAEKNSTENSPKETIPSKELLEILKTQSQMATTKNVTGNFGELNIQKNQSTAMPNLNNKMLNENDESNAKEQQQMFTSMSDIGFPSNAQTKQAFAQKKGEKMGGGELISSDQIQRMMNTQNNWRVRTKCIDEMMHDIQERIDADPEYLMVVSEKLVDFFVKLLTDQNFKIVLNTLNILNMIIGMKEQCLRFEKLMKQELTPDQTWGLSNATLGRHIPQIVKKLADSKNIIRQEAIKCLFGMFEIMRSGSKKDNNFIALILPYLINSSNWHIREELLHLLIKCFLLSHDVQEFDGFQILDSVLRLFNDAKEKIRNLALEAIAAYSSINSKKNIKEILFQLKVEKDLIDIVNHRMDQGMLPFLTPDGALELPFQEQLQNLNYDVDSVAHSMANQSQVGQPQHFIDNSRRKASIGGVSQQSYPNMNRGNSSGRKIVVTTATATNQQLGISQHDEMQQPFLQSKRTASANNPNQLEFENPNFNPHDPPFLNEQNAFSQSVGEGGARSKDLKIMQQYDDPIFQQELSGTSFLPQLQKINYNDAQNNNQYQSQNYYKERVVGSSGGSGMGNINIQGKVDPAQIIGSAGSIGSQHMAQMSGGNRRSNKYLHGTPGHPHNYHGHFSQNETPLNHVFHRGNSGKLNPNQNINNSIYNKSPSLFDSNLLMEMSGNIGSMFGGESKNGIKIIPRSNFNQQMSEIAINDFHDSLSNSGVNHSNYYHQTPSQHDQFMIQPPGEGSMISTKFPLEFNLVNQIPGHGQVHKIGFSSPVNAVVNAREGVAEPRPMMEGYDQGSANMNEQSKQKLIPQKNQKSSSMHKRDGSMGHLNQKMGGIGVAVQSNKKNNQNTFYSDGTTFTGITATTGATNSIMGMKARNQIVMLKPGGPQNVSDQINNNQLPEDGMRFEHEMRQQIIGQGHPQVGPIKATRVAIENQVQSINSQEPINQQNVELVIDSRKFKQGQQKLKINTKVQNSQGIQKMKREYSKESDLDDNLRQTRSFSYTKDSKQNSIHSSKELQSAGIPNRYGYFGKNFTGDENEEDPALLTQSSKIVYISSDELEPLDHPEKEYKKISAKGQGMHSNDWVEQFEACDVIRRVCKHHQSIIIQNGNQLQNLVANLVKLADSLRSAVSRIALMTLNDMFFFLKRVMEPCLITIVKILIKKGTDTNHFIAEEADKCLANMVHNCQEQKVLQVLFMQNMNSGSNQQRLRLCLCLQNLAKQLGNNILFFKENDKLLVQLAKYLQDACQDVRMAAKTSFVLISQAIMGENELERLLQRVLNEVLYKKVREFLDKEPTHLVGKQGSQIDFVITNANGSNNTNKRVSSKMQKSFKELKLGGLTQKQSPVEYSENEPLNIQAKSILNPQAQKQESSGFLNKIASQNKGTKKASMGSEHELDQEFLDQLKDLIGRVISNEWKLRLENSEILFEYINMNVDKVNCFRQVELADVLCRLINDSNAKIQLNVLENFTKTFSQITVYIEQFIQIFYKATLTNLGSSNLGVRKNSEQILKQINEMNNEKMQLLQPLMNMIQFNSNARLKPALLDQLIDMLDQRSEKESHVFKAVLPLSYKLLDDNKIEVKQRTEKLFKKLYQIPSIGQTVIDNCPQTKLQRVCDICLGGSKLSLTGTGSSGKNSTGRGTGTFGANGNSVHLNSRT